MPSQHGTMEAKGFILRVRSKQETSFLQGPKDLFNVFEPRMERRRQVLRHLAELEGLHWQWHFAATLGLELCMDVDDDDLGCMVLGCAGAHELLSEVFAPALTDDPDLNRVQEALAQRTQ